VSDAPFIQPPLNSSSWPGRAPEVAQRLGGRRGVAAHERHGGRALEQVLQALGARLVGGALGQRVLDHPEVASASRSLVRSSAACGTEMPR
jgi:hypothetical protein